MAAVLEEPSHSVGAARRGLSAQMELPSMGEESSDVVSVFEQYIAGQPDISIAVAAIYALTDCVKRSKATTVMGLEIELKAASEKLQAMHPTSISLAAGSELFNRYVTRTSLEISDFEKCKERLISRGTLFALQARASREKISEYGDRFIHDGKVVLVHGQSRVVMSVLLHAATKKGKFFSVVVTEGRPTCAGAKVAAELLKAGIPTTVILDSAVGYIMSKVDLVLVGAEGVVESGGIINQIGTYQLAMVAKALHTPLYVCAESYKFARLFPLNQNDLPDSKLDQKPFALANNDKWPDGVKIENPLSDYTPPQFITLLFTDLGILTPAAVSDELIKLYY